MKNRIRKNKKLDAELARLKKHSGICTDYSLLWIPKADSAKEGEVIGDTIYIYSGNLQDAVETLHHEFFDAMVSNAIRPYVDLVNALMSLISEKAYQKKEDVIESLVRTMRRIQHV